MGVEQSNGDGEEELQSSIAKKIEEAIRVTKGKMVVARYAARRDLQIWDDLQPVEHEPQIFIIKQVFVFIGPKGMGWTR